MFSGSKSRSWRMIVWLSVALLIAPIVIMIYAGASASAQLIVHLWQTVLPTYLSNTLLLVLLVALLSSLIGVVSAAIITHTDVVGKKVLRWLLLLPLAMPAYVVAYLYTDLFDYAGPIQTYLRALFGWQSVQDYYFFDMRTLGGAALVLSLVLYPYVYMLARTAFEQQSNDLERAAVLLGQSPWQRFFKVSLPLARPAIAVAASLVMMETLADFATVQYFAVNTLTTAIYDTWLGYGDLPAANALGSVLMLLVLIVVVAELRARAEQRYDIDTKDKKVLKPLSNMQQIFASGFCWLVAGLGFIVPFSMLVVMAWQYSGEEQFEWLLTIGGNSLIVASAAATVCCAIALILTLYKRLHNDKFSSVPLQLSGLGYAIPGTVVAMAVLATLAPLDHGLNYLTKLFDEKPIGLVLSGSAFAIVFAYIIRFAAIANGTVSSGMSQIHHSLDLVPASLGVGHLRAIRKVHIPLLKSSLWVAWLLVFVEGMKELPATLLVRPFNFDTLSTRVYALVSNEMLEQGALAAIFIVLFGLLPIIWLNKQESM